VTLDGEANARGDLRISGAASDVAAYVIPTAEEAMIAHHTSKAAGIDMLSAAA
jgi:acetate kinase